MSKSSRTSHRPRARKRHRHANTTDFRDIKMDATLPISKQITDAIANGVQIEAFKFTETQRQMVDKVLNMLVEQERMSKPFRFVDLPAELRNRIYSLVMAADDDKPLNLASFASPAVARVSKQLRSEALPIFFAEARFHAIVGATIFNLAGRNGNVALLPRSDTMERDRKASGVLHMRREVQKFLGETKAVLRNVTLYVVDGSNAYANTRRHMTTSFAYSILHLGYDKGSSHLSVEAGYRAKYLHASSCDQGDIDAHMNPAKEEGEKIVAKRKDFKGFTLSDIRKIAKHFRQA